MAPESVSAAANNPALLHYQEQQHVGTSPQVDVLTHHDTGLVILSFLNVHSLGAVGVSSRSLNALANTDAAWRNLLLAERPHLAPLLPIVVSAKAYYWQRKKEEGNENYDDDEDEEDEDEEEEERERLRQRLAHAFLYLELSEPATNQLLGSVTIPLSDEARVHELLHTGIAFTFPRDDRSIPDSARDWRTSLLLVDLSGGAVRRVAVSREVDDEWQEAGSVTLNFLCTLLSTPTDNHLEPHFMISTKAFDEGGEEAISAKISVCVRAGGLLDASMLDILRFFEVVADAWISMH
jgi:hypothetical protein